MARDARRLRQEIERLGVNCGQRSRDRQFTLGVHWADSGDEVDFIYRKYELLVDSQSLDMVFDAFDRINEPRPSVSRETIGLTVLDLGERDATQVLDSLTESLEDTHAVSYNYVLDSQGYPSMCPASEPLPWRGPVPELGEPAGPGHARIAVVDTGYLASAARESGFRRFKVVEKASEPDDETYFEGTTQIRPYGGHGTATTARLLAVSAVDNVTVRVRDCLVGGAIDEITIVEDLVSVIEGGVDIISIQAGLYTQMGHSPMAFNAFQRWVLSKHPDIVIVAAAGNNGSDQPFWPAAYDWVTAVGALTHGGDARTGWTNFGHWVDVYASGENVVVPFPNGTYEYLTKFSAEFTEGHALWSGTSFAAPVVAGMIARRMIERNVSAPEARAIVLAEAAIAALPNTGPRVIV